MVFTKLQNKFFFLYQLYIIFLAPFYYNIKNSLNCYKNSLKNINKNSFYYPHFDTQRSYILFWYRAVIYNLKKYGKLGKTNYLGNKDYPLSVFWHYNYYSTDLYFKYGFKLLFFSAIIFFLSSLYLYNSFSIKNENFDHFYILLFLYFFLSKDYSDQFFRYQNYNIVGWVFLPISMYFFSINDLYFFYFFYFLGSILSFSFFFIISYIYSVIFLLDKKFIYILFLQLPIFFYLLKAIKLNSKNFLKDFLFISIVSNFKLFDKKSLPNSKESIFEYDEFIYFLSKIQFIYFFYNTCIFFIFNKFYNNQNIGHTTYQNCNFNCFRICLFFRN